jgi:hypothetical protein
MRSREARTQRGALRFAEGETQRGGLRFLRSKKRKPIKI